MLSPDADLWIALTFFFTGVICWCVAAVVLGVAAARAFLRATAKVTGRHRGERRPVLDEDDATLILRKLRDGLAGPLAGREGEQ